jgi:hypothetical protein
MKSLIAAVIIAGIFIGCNNSGKELHNQLSKEEIEQGWELLFDGKTFNGWRGLGRDTVETNNWKVENGEISALETLLVLREIRGECETIVEHIKNFEEQFHDEITTEAQKYGNVYNGFNINSVAGRKLFNFNNVPDVLNARSEAQRLEAEYKSAFEAYQKNLVQTTRDENGQLLWIDADGELKPFPEVNYGKSFIQIKKQK